MTLSPGQKVQPNGGGLGARSLNIELQNALNPPGEVRIERPPAAGGAGASAAQPAVRGPRDLRVPAVPEFPGFRRGSGLGSTVAQAIDPPRVKRGIASGGPLRLRAGATFCRKTPYSLVTRVSA